jgi:hypothetical protein
VSNTALRFRSASREVVWMLNRIVAETVADDCTTWLLSNRKTASGIGGTHTVPTILRGLMIWARALPRTVNEAIVYFESAQERYEKDVSTLTQRLESERQSLRTLSKSE